jgi:carbon-monoxide dehydrogenase medium subunit
MYPAPFRYLRPASIQEALDCLGELEAKARVLAGGASLIPQLKYRQITPNPEVLVDISRLAELTGSVRENGHVVVGSMTRHVEFSDDEELSSAVPGARDVSLAIGDQQVRNMGTVGGGLAAVEATGDWGPCLLAAQGSVRVSSSKGSREIEAAELFAGPLRTTLQPDELLTGVVFPMDDGRRGSAHAKLYVRAVTALGSCSVFLTLDDQERVTNVGVGVGGLTPVPVAVPEVASVLMGEQVTPAAAEAAKAALVDALATHSDAKTTSAHRRSVAGSLFYKALYSALARAQGGDVPPPNVGGRS